MIQVEGLWKSYGNLQVLKGLDLFVEKGETLVILGRSGVGKSVLLKQILGLETPDAGRVEVDGNVITEMTERERYQVSKKMGMLFQGAALFDSLSIYDNVAFHLRQHGNLDTMQAYSEGEIQDRVEEALHMVGLEGVEDKMPSDLSGGMRKRAALARIIIYQPQVLLYDEPTTGLDPITAMQINDLIVKFQKELHATSIVVTHDLKSALTVGNRLALHFDGKISHVEKKETFFDHDDPLVKSFYENALYHSSKR